MSMDFNVGQLHFIACKYSIITVLDLEVQGVSKKVDCRKIAIKFTVFNVSKYISLILSDSISILKICAVC